MATDSVEPPDSLEFLLYVKEEAEIRAFELHNLLTFIEAGGVLLQEQYLNKSEQIRFGNVGIYCLNNEIRLYTVMIEELQEE